MTIGKSGTRVTTGIPGTGLSYTTKLNKKSRSKKQAVTVSKRTSFFSQLLWFLLVGWWLGAIIVIIAYICFALIITIPIGVSLINQLPSIIARRRSSAIAPMPSQVQVKQRNFLIRAAWFVCVGFWLAFLWMVVAYALCLTIIGMPIGFWMFEQTPGILTLRKSA
ncbi:MAG: YccF domain-containing protein [Chloroflexi bacterium]|nr:YccF domain-containing protein [Chloroflexota bacterium]